MEQLNEVTKYVLYRCREKNIPLTEIMASFIVQTIYNPKTYRFYLEDKLSYSEMRDLKYAALRKISAKYSLDMKIIDMQISYYTEYLSTYMKKQSDNQQEVIASGEHIDNVVNFEVKNAKDFEGLTQLYKKIFNYLLYKNKEVIPSENYELNQFKIEKYVAAALESVIPRAALGPFITLSSSEKITQLVYLSNLVIGIRLFNQEIGKGGAGLLKLSELLNNNFKQVRSQAFKYLYDITYQCERYTNVFKVEQRKKMVMNPTEFKRLKNYLMFIRQYRTFMITLEEEISVSENSLNSNYYRYEREVYDLKNLLGSKSSAPKEQVYPRFAILAQSYISVYEYRKYAYDKIRLYYHLKYFRKSFPLSLSQKYFYKASQYFYEGHGDIHNAHLYDLNHDVYIFMPSTSPDFLQKTCDYLGFCIWSVVKNDGLLLPGEPELGVYKYKDKSCVFSSIEAVKDFLKDPDTYFSGVLRQCRKNPYLIHFLRLEYAFKHVQLSLAVQAVYGNIKNKLMIDKSVETPVHFVQRNIDPNYCWNYWELRKKAIQMANIRKTSTRADQTLLSNFRVDSDTQTYLKSDAATNTNQNMGTQYKAEKNK